MVNSRNTMFYRLQSLHGEIEEKSPWDPLRKHLNIEKPRVAVLLTT